MPRNTNQTNNHVIKQNLFERIESEEERPAYPGDFHLDVTLIRLINLFTTLIYLILNHIFHLQRVKLYQNEENRMHENSNIYLKIMTSIVTVLDKTFNQRYLYDLITSCLISIPGLDIEFYIDSFGTSTKYKIGMLIAVVQFLKFTPYFDLVLLTSRYTNAQGSKICFNNGILADMLFQFKVNMRLRPLQILIAAYLFGILIFGFTILIFEQYTPESTINDLGQSIWLTFVTFNTIGYGDQTPVTLWGRIFLVIACIWGVSIYSIFVVSMQTMTFFQPSDQQAYKQIVIDQDKQNLKDNAGKLIKSFILYSYLRKRDMRHPYRKMDSRIPKLFDIFKGSRELQQIRLIQMQKEPEIESLLLRAERQIQISKEETELVADKFDSLGFNIHEILYTNQATLSNTINSCLDLSFQLANFGKFLMEYDGQYPVQDFQHIDSKKLRPSDEIRQSILLGLQQDLTVKSEANQFDTQLLIGNNQQQKKVEYMESNSDCSESSSNQTISEEENKMQIAISPQEDKRNHFDFKKPTLLQQRTKRLNKIHHNIQIMQDPLYLIDEQQSSQNQNQATSSYIQNSYLNSVSETYGYCTNYKPSQKSFKNVTLMTPAASDIEEQQIRQFNTKISPEHTHESQGYKVPNYKLKREEIMNMLPRLKFDDKTKNYSYQIQKKRMSITPDARNNYYKNNLVEKLQQLQRDYSEKGIANNPEQQLRVIKREVKQKESKHSLTPYQKVNLLQGASSKALIQGMQKSPTQFKEKNFLKQDYMRNSKFNKTNQIEIQKFKLHLQNEGDFDKEKNQKQWRQVQAKGKEQYGNRWKFLRDKFENAQYLPIDKIEKRDSNQ
eukprot:403348837